MGPHEAVCGSLKQGRVRCAKRQPVFVCLELWVGYGWRRLVSLESHPWSL